MLCSVKEPRISKAINTSLSPINQQTLFVADSVYCPRTPPPLQSVHQQNPSQKASTPGSIRSNLSSLTHLGHSVGGSFGNIVDKDRDRDEDAVCLVPPQANSANSKTLNGSNSLNANPSQTLLTKTIISSSSCSPAASTTPSPAKNITNNSLTSTQSNLNSSSRNSSKSASSLNSSTPPTPVFNRHSPPSPLPPPIPPLNGLHPNPSQQASIPASIRNNNSLSSLTQLSQSIGGVTVTNAVEKNDTCGDSVRFEAASSEKNAKTVNGSNSQNSTPSLTASVTTTSSSCSPSTSTNSSGSKPGNNCASNNSSAFRNHLWTSSSSLNPASSPQTPAYKPHTSTPPLSNLKATHQNPSQRASTPANLRSCNSSLSSLSQSAVGAVSNSKERERDNASTSEFVANVNSKTANASNPRNTAVSQSLSISNSSTTSTSSKGSNSSLGNLSTRNHLWGGSSSNPFLSGGSGSIASTTGPHLPSPGLPPRVATPAPGLQHSSALHSNHSLTMFAPPIPAPPVSLSSVGGAAAPSATASPFMGDSLFPPPNQDLLRRELDTRFLASHDRSISIPPPPYMRSEMHQHSHIHSTPPYALPPNLGGPLVPPSPSHLYDKFPKLDSAFYGRSALGLTGFPSLSPLMAPGAPNSTPGTLSSTPGGPVGNSSTPFGPPGHLAAFQPKKSGRWCAMHVRIAWEIYHHQQKQQQLEATHKSPIVTTTNSGSTNTSKSGHHSSEILRPLNNLFSLPPRAHPDSFSSSLLSVAAGHSAQRPPLDPSPLNAPHGTYGPIGVPPYLRPSFPGFPNFGTLGALGLPAGPNSSNLFAPSASGHSGRDISGASMLPGLGGSLNDAWMRANSTPRTTPSLFQTLTPPISSNSSSLNAAGWGGLKAEAERERHQEEVDKQRKTSSSDDGRRVESKMNSNSSNSSGSGSECRTKSDDKPDGKHKEGHQSVTHKYSTHSSIDSSMRNGDISHEHRREWEKGYKRELSRSPLNHHPNKILKTDSSAFNDKSNDIKVKEERKENSLSHNSHQVDKVDRHSVKVNNDLELGAKTGASVLTNTPLPPLPTSAGNSMASTASLAAMSLSNPLERARLMGLFGLHGGPPPVGPHMAPGSNATDPLKSFWSFFPPPAHHPDPFKSLHDFPSRTELLEREHLLQRYNILNSSGGGAPLTEKLAKESSLHSLIDKDIREKEHLNSLDKHKMARPGDPLAIPSSFSSSLPHATHLPPPTPSLFPPNPYLNSLHSLSASAGSNVRVKCHSNPSSLSSASSTSSSSSKSSPSPQSSSKTVAANGITAPPPLIPSNPVANNGCSPQKLFSTKISVNSLIENSLECVKELSRGRERTSISNPSTPAANGSSAVAEVGESQSR
ncbi:autism susceptibility gene 2 protein-like protein [Dinothrombium tinctorium]|uniref:Autism susceptibility gene 2 protein-like protein n=1 Tax=Dinothrombium tinctorium TaxID=1965070 RepID=A0A443RNA4_9ACAR|nr:autism susceptibility gene 2 protein-like protein [Dinothrombium tinctorium]